MDLTQQANTMFQSLTKVLSKQVYVGQSVQILNPAMQVNLVKNNISSLNTTQSLSDSQITIPSFCELLSSSNCQSSIITQNVMVFIWNFT